MTSENTDLEMTLLRYHAIGNLTVDVIRKAVVSQSTCSAFDKPLTTYYVFFPKTETSIQITLGQCGIYLPLEPAKYGIDDMVESRGITMDELLEEVGAGVNNAMEYDFEIMEKTLTAEIGKLSEGDPYRETKIRERERYKEMQRSYKTTGNEVVKGVCSDAGKLIREELFAMGLGQMYGIIMVGSTNGQTSHDTTLVFNKETGHWAVINSKIPVKVYNLVPKENLVEIGRPYVAV